MRSVDNSDVTQNTMACMLREQVMNINELAALGMAVIQPSSDLDIDYSWPCNDLDIGGDLNRDSGPSS